MDTPSGTGRRPGIGHERSTPFSRDCDSESSGHACAAGGDACAYGDAI